MKLRLLKNRTGSYIAEAAVVLPIIIFAVITTVLIVMFFYQESVEKSKMHIALRCQAGQVSEKTVYYTDDSVANAESIWDGAITINRKGLTETVSAQKNISLISNGLLHSGRSKTISGKWNVLNPANSRRFK